LEERVTPAFSLVIPAYDEAARIGATIGSIVKFLDRSMHAELIVVDDGSTDGTSKVASAALDNSRVPSRVLRYEQNRGKGYAVRTGLLAARAPIAVFTDADLSTPIEELSKVVEPIRQGAVDVAFGSRALDRTLIGIHQPRTRELGGRVFNLVLRAATGLPFKDTQCGFKAFRMSTCRPIIESATIDRFGFDVELLFAAHRHGLRLAEVPVRWNHCDGSKVSMARDSLRMLREVFTIRRQYRYGGTNTPAGLVHDRAGARAHI
jgi:glycosyltransferase involved in cell wall biosynthesis